MQFPMRFPSSGKQTAFEFPGTEEPEIETDRFISNLQLSDNNNNIRNGLPQITNSPREKAPFRTFPKTKRADYCHTASRIIRLRKKIENV